MGRIFKPIFLLIVFLLPLVGPFQSLGYEEAKVLFFLVATSISAFAWVIYLSKTGNKIKWDKIKIIAALFVIALGITSFLGADIKASFFGREPYFQGFILYSYLFLFFLMISSLKVGLEEWAKVLSASSLVVSLVAIADFISLNFLGKDVPTYAGRVVSTFGQPNFYAGFLLITLPFSLMLLDFKKEGRALGLLGLFGSVGAILISGSRASILLLLPLFVWWLVGRIKNSLAVFGILGMLVLVLLASILVSVGSRTGLVWQEIVEPNTAQVVNSNLWTASAEKRFYLYPVVWSLINQSSFLGYGLENIQTAFSGYFEENKHPLFEENLSPSSVLIRLKDLTVDRSHSYFLDILMFSGLLGFLAWGALVVILVKKAHQWAILSSLLVYLIWSQFQNQSVVHLLYFWLLVGLIDNKKP